MSNLLKKFNVNAFPLPMIFFFVGSFFMFIRMIIASASWIGSYYYGTSAGFSFMNIMTFLALIGIGVCMIIKVRIGVAGAAAWISLMEFINTIVALAFCASYRASALCFFYYFFKFVAILCLAAVVVLPCFITKAKTWTDKLFFIPGATYALVTLFGIFNIGSACSVFILLENGALTAAIFLFGAWIRNDTACMETGSRKEAYNPYGSAPNQGNVVHDAEAKVVVYCPSCGQGLRLPIGKELQVTCPKCKNTFKMNT